MTGRLSYCDANLLQCVSYEYRRFPESKDEKSGAYRPAPFNAKSKSDKAVRT